MVRIAAGLLLLPGATGCYTYHPVTDTQSLNGRSVALAITDRGRVGLGERLGEGVLRVAGTLADQNDTSVVVRVAEVQFLNGTTSHWNGESVRFNRSFIQSASQRSFSRSKSALAAAVVLGAVTAFIVTRSLIAGGTSDGGDSKPPGGTTGQQ
jgi:hypothetical protein